MAVDAQELRKRSAESKPEENEMLHQVIQAFGQRDAFPSNKMKKVTDANGNVNSYAFEVVNPWYQAQPVCTIKSLEVTINGQAVPEDTTYFVFREQIIPSKLAKTFFEFWWGFAEKAEIHVENTSEISGMIKAQNDVEVKLEMAMLMIDDAAVVFDLKNKMEVQ
jgi:hypothetical protein